MFGRIAQPIEPRWHCCHCHRPNALSEGNRCVNIRTGGGLSVGAGFLSLGGSRDTRNCNHLKCQFCQTEGGAPPSMVQRVSPVASGARLRVAGGSGSSSNLTSTVPTPKLHGAILKNEIARQFWETHVGADKEVSMNIFAEGFVFEYNLPSIQKSEVLEFFQEMDESGDGMISIYEYARFTERGDLFTRFKQNQTANTSKSLKTVPPPPPPPGTTSRSSFTVKALYDYQGRDEEELTFSEGDLITITKPVDLDMADWFEGAFLDGQWGRVPCSYVERYTPPPPPPPPAPPKVVSQSGKSSPERRRRVGPSMVDIIYGGAYAHYANKTSSPSVSSSPVLTSSQSRSSVTEAATDTPPEISVFRGMDAYERNNFVDAVSHFELAADMGDRDGQYQLANCYHHGLGVRKNKEKALALYQLAAQQGCPVSAMCLKKFDKMVAPPHLRQYVQE